LTLGNTPLPVSLIPAMATMGPHTEQTIQPTLMGIGSHTVEMGKTSMINNQAVAITTAAGGATIAIIQANPGEGAAVTTVVLGMSGAVGPEVGGIFAPKPAALANELPRGPVTVGNTVLIPNTDGSFVVSGTSLIVGGAPITIFSGGSGTAGGGLVTGGKPSSTVLSLTTDARGSGVLIVNGKTSTVAGPLETGTRRSGTAKPAQSTSSAAATKNNELNGWFCIWMGFGAAALALGF